MKFLVDRCAGRRLADWLRSQGHDVLASTEGPDPGDRALLQQAFEEQRILITIDTDFGQLVFSEAMPHRGLVRLPDVPAQRRIQLMAGLLEHHHKALVSGSIITIKGDRIRIAEPPTAGEP